MFATHQHGRVRPAATGAVRWADGFWAERFRTCRETMLPSMRQALDEPENAAVLANFAVGAGQRDGQHRGTFWSDGDCYKYVQALAHVFEVTRDEALDREMDEIIEAIRGAQEPDGYLNTQIQLTDKERWTNKIHHELYNLGHLLTAGSVHHRVTGKDTLLDVARRAADYLHELFAPRPPELAHFGFNPSQIMGLVDLYRETGEPRYLELAGVFVDMRGSRPWPWDLAGLAALGDAIVGDQCQDRVPLREEAQAVGHAVTATYLWAGAADVCAEAGDETLLAALQRIWENVVTRRMYVTGAVGPQHHGVSTRDDKVHEAFAGDWELPNRTAYNETCANIGNAMWNRRMLELTGDAKHADVMERVLYNSLLSATDIQGTRFCYTNPLARGPRDLPLLSNDSSERWFTWKCYCCPPSVARTLASLHEWAYGVSDEGLWVHLYGGNRVEAELATGSRVVLAQTTEYPWAGEVRLR
ncbi:MAG: glycoside hydrolase family 127 protein, partial [Armatimonadetes bacterium]|nr:glycoside hydrolase family 127 protein [Armatimonadota bacterium]